MLLQQVIIAYPHLGQLVKFSSLSRFQYVLRLTYTSSASEFLAKNLEIDFHTRLTCRPLFTLFEIHLW